MDKKAIIEEFFKEIETEKWRDVATFLTDDFHFMSSTHEDQSIMSYRLDKDMWLNFQKAIKDAFPEWSFHISHAKEIEHGLEVTVRISGKHEADLIFPAPYSLHIPASGITINLPMEHAIFHFRQDKIAKLVVQDITGGGLPGMLQQLNLNKENNE